MKLGNKKYRVTRRHQVDLQQEPNEILVNIATIILFLVAVFIFMNTKGGLFH